MKHFPRHPECWWLIGWVDQGADHNVAYLPDLRSATTLAIMLSKLPWAQPIVHEWNIETERWEEVKLEQGQFGLRLSRCENRNI